jgi:hypothetical protein
MNVPERFADTGKALTDVATHFVVHCPKCEGKALVDPDGKSWTLKCTSCFHVESPGRWYGSMTAYASVKCRECNAPMRRSSSSSGEWKKIRMKCDQCGDVCEYEAHLFRLPLHDGLMCDPVFGLPLWLQDTFRGELFWAYNYDHLTLLEDYIKAKHRERGIEPRNTIRKNSSMMSRLPEFMRKGGNRKALSSLIEALQTK